MEELTVDAPCFMPSLKTQDGCGGVCDFRYVRDTRAGQITGRRAEVEAVIVRALGDARSKTEADPG